MSNPETITASARCILCCTTETVDVPRNDGRWSRFYFQGEFAQVVYPELTGNERSILLGHAGSPHICDDHAEAERDDDYDPCWGADR